jgi:streptomycin 6-kinase
VAGEHDETIVIPQAFLDMPRWWRDGQAWLADLPAIIHAQCRRFGLRIDGGLAHGSNAIVVPVRDRAGQELVLRLNPSGPEAAEQVAALRFWAGRGTVLLVDADPDEGVMLLERLAVGHSLSEEPVAEAIAVLGAMMRRLAVPAPSWARGTTDVARIRAAELEPRWRQLGRPFDAAFLTAALHVAPQLSVTSCAAAVNADLHSAQVLRGRREPWLVVDPVLLRGDIEYDLARVLWTRIDEMPDGTTVLRHFDTAVAEAGLDRDRARAWVLFRTVDYWLWGLRAGLTEDPLRCLRLATVFAG